MEQPGSQAQGKTAKSIQGTEGTAEVPFCCRSTACNSDSGKGEATAHWSESPVLAPGDWRNGWLALRRGHALRPGAETVAAALRHNREVTATVTTMRWQTRRWPVQESLGNLWQALRLFATVLAAGQAVRAGLEWDSFQDLGHSTKSQPYCPHGSPQRGSPKTRNSSKDEQTRLAPSSLITGWCKYKQPSCNLWIAQARNLCRHQPPGWKYPS